MGCLQEGKYSMQEVGGRGHLLEGGVFSGAYDFTHREKVATVQTRMSSERIVSKGMYIHRLRMPNKSNSWTPETTLGSGPDLSVVGLMSGVQRNQNLWSCGD